ncbi:sensor histidine kinase [Nocardioides sp. TF02-7]|uniref:sensor histidine kinase n=1 Tax=Nocardioides sp. TF02-7 TaxID=2917724 RepID=UPI001F0637D1|nr:sensor histidine kinase [Nocardioides sp. TF02-7]UMG92974.1 sensor histidine kinase [Nocardioides sp. TF02-7]
MAKDRDRIARDLHDLVIQRLFATGMQLQAARSSADLDGLRERVDEAVAELDTAIDDLRATIFELGRGGGRSLHEAVRALIGEYAPVLGFLPVLRTTGPVDTALAPEVADGVLMTLREALSNVARHASASSASIDLEASPGRFTLRLTDDGCGFDPDTVTRGQGLDNAAHRAEALGGRVDLTSAPGEGTRLTWTVPALG